MILQPRVRSAKSHLAIRKPLFESLEPRAMLASISISDATAVESDQALKYIDRFVADSSGGLARPRQLIFGPDANADGAVDLYVSSVDTNEVLRFDGKSGAFLDVFVASGSGGLNNPADLKFGRDGNLYVNSFRGNQLLRFNGSTGAFIDVAASGLNGPHGLTLGNDGSLYIANFEGHNVLRYDASGMSVFVSAGSGGLGFPRHAVFGPDANEDGNDDLYVMSQLTKQVLRYDGMSGQFIDTYLTKDASWLEFGTDGLLYTTIHNPTEAAVYIERFDDATGTFVDKIGTGRNGWSFAIGPDGLIYHCGNASANNIDRFGHSSLAVFTASLSEPSPWPITVTFSTSNGSATAEADYAAVTGTLTFAPGQTTRTILVRTLGDGLFEPSETFLLNLSNAVGGAIADGEGIATIQDNENVKLQTPTVTAAATAPNRVHLTWTDDSIGESGFKIERSDTGTQGQFTQVAAVGAGVTSYQDLNLQSSHGYSYRVRAYKGATDGPASKTTPVATPQLHTINGTSEADAFIVVRAGTLLMVYHNTQPEGQPTFSSQLAAMSGMLSINAGDGDDFLIADAGSAKDLGLAQLLYNAGLGANLLGLKRGAARIDSTAAGTGTLDTLVLADATLTTSRLKQNELFVEDGGRVAILPGGTQANVVTALDLNATGTLDIADNALVVDYTGNSPLPAIRDRILSGRGGPSFGATWAGAGINSSAASQANATEPESRSIAFAENAGLPLGPYTAFRGQPVDATSVLIALTRTGDANLDGLVSDDDVTIVGAAYAPGVPQPSWGLGDFDYNGFVDDDDVTLLGAFYSPSANPSPAPRRPAFQGRPEYSTALEGHRTDQTHLWRLDMAAIQQLLADADVAFSPKRKQNAASLLTR